MSQWPVRLILLAATTGILLPYCFPKYDLGLLAWVALIPLHIALASSSRRSQAFWLGWLAGIVSSTGIMSWVVTAMHTYGKVPLVISYIIMLLLTAYLGLFVALYSAGVVWFRMLVPRYGLFAAPCLWVALELLRTYLFTGLPWSLLGYSQYRQLDVIQIADHLGVYGVSFLIVLTNVALAELYLWLMPLFRGFRPARLPWELVTTSAMLVGLSWAYSTSLIVSEGMEQLKTSLRVGVVQPNIDQAVKWDQAYRDETLKRYDRLTESFGYGVDLVVWPEAATPFIYEREPVYQLQLVSMASRASAPL
ncbi:MAG TPA: apolipoprotein N-acyltransferase, partial [Nitrospira sp.]|nr:apolipoprotein N-acyltransferase [Nitrospira sp.]